MTSFLNSQVPLPNNGAHYKAKDSEELDEHQSPEWRNGRLTKTNSSPPVYRDRRHSYSHSEWDIRRPWSQIYTEEEAEQLLNAQSTNALLAADQPVTDRSGPSSPSPTPSSNGLPPALPFSRSSSLRSSGSSAAGSEGVLQKFRKTLSLRFYNKGKTPLAASASYHSGSVPQVISPEQAPVSPQVTEEEKKGSLRGKRRGSIGKDEVDGETVFRIGPLVWRSSKERRKGRKKDSRGTKCNSADSGDSGIQMEAEGEAELPNEGVNKVMVNVTPASPNPIVFPPTSPVVLRRCRSSTQLGRKPRPLSDISGSASGILQEIKAGLQDDGRGRRGGLRRRTLSDLGDDGSLVDASSRFFRRQHSSPSPIKMRPEPTHKGRKISSVNQFNKSIKRSRARCYLRRSLSQPMDLDKLLPPGRELCSSRSPSPCPRHQPRRPSAANVLDDLRSNSIAASSEDEDLSDSEHSIVGDLMERRKSFEQRLEDNVVLAEALWDHITMEPDELGFRAGDVIEVLDCSDRDWWWGTINDRDGWFPQAFVRLRVNQEDTVEDCLDKMASGELQISVVANRKLSVSLLSNDQVRTNVIREILNTENDFVRNLTDVVEGYLRQARRRPDMFSESRLNRIFGNIERLHSFQQEFLASLKEYIDTDRPHVSCVGQCFVQHRTGFEIYSEYCNNHPVAISELQELYQDTKYVHFFEACRLIRHMIDISLDGFLLTPVQRICKYPLQLQELLKYTKPEHSDYQNVKEALEVMRNVATLINERKRQMESLERLALWQLGLEGWEGNNLLDTSSELIHQGEVVKISSGGWTKEVTLLLFDHLLIYCKKDMLKRNTLVFKGRIHTDTCEIVDIPDGKDPQFNTNVHYAWKIHCVFRNKWYLFHCRTFQEKIEWMAAFREERSKVGHQLKEGSFPLSPRVKHLAYSAAANHNKPKKPKNKPVQYDPRITLNMMASMDLRNRSVSLPQAAPLLPSGDSPVKKKNTWFGFGANRKRGSQRGNNAQKKPG